jgi:hypothetical protein
MIDELAIERTDSQNDGRFVGLVALTGLVVGILLWLLTVGLSRSRISGNGWSLAGNGALIIPFGLGPAIVAGGWAAVVLRMRRHPRWRQLGVASGLIGLVLVAASLLALVLFGPSNRDAGAAASVFLGFLLYAWLVVSPIAALMVPGPNPALRRMRTWSIVALLVLPVTLIAGCEAGAAVLPA